MNNELSFILKSDDKNSSYSVISSSNDDNLIDIEQNINSASISGLLHYESIPLIAETMVLNEQQISNNIEEQILNSGTNLNRDSLTGSSDNNVILSESLDTLDLQAIDNILVTVQDFFNEYINNQTGLDINFIVADLPAGILAKSQIANSHELENSVENTILIDDDADGFGWFIDETPLDNNEFIAQNSASYFIADNESAAQGKYDLLTTVFHEFAHLYGFIDGYAGFERLKVGEFLVGDNFTATLDGEHLDEQAHPYDLLNPHLAPGVRKLPSELDVEILNTILAFESETIDADLEALLTSDPSLGITNGDFSISDKTSDDLGWEIRGAGDIVDGQAVLAEDSSLLSNLSQTFIVPEDINNLQFTLVEVDLDQGAALTPPDSFEVAILDPVTLNSLVNTDIGLNKTDALLNIQNDGTTYFGDKVRIDNFDPGTIIDYTPSRTINIDISDIPAGTEATLYLDLLGFGAVDSRVVIDDVQLTAKIAPIAADDSITRNQGESVIIDILSNDIDPDGLINPDSVDIVTQPNNGFASAVPDGSGAVSYLPGNGFAGTDSFTYTVQDYDEQTSNLATVNVTIVNVAPTIDDIQIPENIIEGTETTITAIASDPGNDELTYLWNIDTQTSSTNTSQITETFTFDDNGNYSGTLIVSDPYGGSDTEDINIEVENAAPIVDAGADQTVDEGDSVNFNGNFSDPGINDTQTFAWDLGDSSAIVTDTLTPIHAYTDDGIYTATLTVTDNDGGVGSDTLEITVNNVAPTITNLTVDNNIIDEGDTVNFFASATDPGDDELTYTWDFGDGSEQLSVTSDQLSVSHTYSDNGNYTVTLTVTDDDGGLVSDTLDVIVNNVAPTIEELIGETEINEGESVSYRATATDPGDDTLTYSWDFGDGTIVEGTNVTHTFVDNGTYDATLTVTDDDGATATRDITIEVANVAPSITTAPTQTAIEGDIVTFEASFFDPGDDELTVVWDFGDGSEQLSVTSDQLSVEHTYPTKGIYTATVTVTDDDGGVTTSNIEVTINNRAPVIETLTGDDNLDEGDTANFSAIATDLGDDELTYTWDFGDGSDQLSVTSDQLPVSHTFADDGNYIVTLTVTDEDGAFTSQTLDVTVNNVAPIIENIIGEREIDEGSEVAYSAIATDPGDDELTYVWEFSDGTTVEGKDITHTFADNGNYTTTLTVSDDDGASVSQTLEIRVNNVAPTIEDIIGETVVNEKEEVTYSAIATDPGDDELTYVWEFSDGTIVEGKDITHTFADNGNYTITLTVTDDDGASTSQTLDITVNNIAPTIEDIIGETEIDEGAEVNYDAIASDLGDGELTYTWDFGDGSDQLSVTSDELPVSHTFADDGNYVVTLTVADEDGGSVSDTLDMVVNNVAPTIEELIGDTEIHEGEEVSYSAIATDPGDDELTYAWEFSDGTIVEGKDITHTFADNGNYSMTLTVTDDDGGSTSRTLDVVVNNVAPTITDIIGEREVDEGSEVTYSAIATDPGDDELTYSWEFSDGTIVEGKDITHTFADNGNYSITLTVIDDDGAFVSQTLDVLVNNVAPTITEIVGETVVDEGSEVTYSAIAIDPGDDELTYVWELSDGTTVDAKDITQTFADNGNYAITLTVTDDDGASTSQTLDITVNNIAPTITEIIGETVVDEGSEVSYSAIASDIGDDELTYSWDFGDGTIAEGKDVTHPFADNGNYTITLTVTDDDGASTSQTLDIVVNNVTPLIDPWLDQTVDEGELVVFNASFSDPGILDSHTIQWYFGDGSEVISETIDSSELGTYTLTQTHTYRDDGVYTATLTIIDKDGATTNNTMIVTVNNVAPVITYINEVDEGEEVPYRAIAFDPGDDELTYVWDFGDGTTVEGANVIHTFTDDGIYTVNLTVTDDDGASTTSTSLAIVNNVAPTITDIIGETVVDEGSEVTYSAIVEDPGDDELTYSWELSDGTIVEGKDLTHTFAENGNYTFTLTVTDDDGGSTSQTLDITVNNVAPTITEIIGETEVDEGSEVSYSAIASDPGDDELTYSWDFGDGTIVEGKDTTHTFTDNGNYTVTLTVTDDDGASTIQTLDIVVNNVAPTIIEIIGETEVNEGSEVAYSAIATDPGDDELTYSWEFSDGTILEGKDVTYTFADNGNYTVTLTVTDDDGGSTSQTLDLVVNSVAPTITEIIGETEVDEGSEVTYSAIATDPGDDELTYSWEFSDGTIVEGKDITHTFADNGNYTMTLTVTDDDGGSTTETLDITVNNVAPTITEIIGETEVDEGSEVSYNAIASDPGDDELTYSWELSDGTILEGKDITHTFADNGNYTVTLTVTDDDDASTSQTLDVVVNNVAPTITEIMGETIVDEGSEVSYSAIATDPGNDELTYAWEFSDGTITEGKDVTHTFADNGNYTATLTVTDDDGGSTTETLDVVVNNVAPTITEIIGETEVNEGAEVSYSAIATDPGDDELTYSWEFSDGTITEGKDVTHTFADNGNYTVTLTVTDDDGGSTTETLDITVNNVAPTITEIIGETEVNEGSEVSYSAIAADPGDDELTYSWELSDGTIVEGKDVTHTFADNGNYTATLTVTDDDGASTSQTLDVLVSNVAPTITEIIGETEVDEGTEVSYSAIASDPGDDELTYSWEFSDGTIVEGQDVTHTFVDNGNYTVTLTVTDDDGASTSQTLDITVNNVAPTITEIIGETEVNEGTEVSYSAIASDLGEDELTYSWEFSDGTIAEGKDITHTFADNGNYTVTLTVTDDDGASVSQTLDVVVNNVAPTITEIMGETVVDEGEEVSSSAIATDPGDDELTYSWEFSDRTIVEGKDITHTFADNGNYTVALTVTDNDGASTSQTLDVVVNNVAPTITEIIGETEVNEGTEVSYSAIATDPGDDELTYSWDFGDGTIVEGKDITHTFADNGNYTVMLTVTDDDGGSTTQTLEVQVKDNKPPIIGIINTNLVQNWSFEDNEVQPNRWDVFENISGWETTEGPGIEVQELNDDFGLGAEGNAWVELDSYGNSSMKQDIATQPETSYQLSFAYSPRPNLESQNSNAIAVYWNGELLDRIRAQGSENNNWTTYTYTVAASDLDLTALEFRAVGQSDSVGGFIDAVSVQEIIYLPESVTIQILEQQNNVIDLVAFDPEGETEGNGLTYRIIGGSDATSFDIDPETGVVSFIESPSFAEPHDLDSDNIYDLEVEVSDSHGLTDTVKLAIAVKPIDQPPPVQMLGENKVQNWSFEDNEVQPNRWGVFNSITGWITTRGAGIEVQELNNRFGLGDDGSTWVELDSQRNSRMQQDIPTKSEASYQLSFAYSPRPHIKDDSNGIEVYWNGTLLDKIKKSGRGKRKNQWQTYTYTVSASDLDLTALEFRAVGKSDSKGGFIDSVSVREIIA